MRTEKIIIFLATLVAAIALTVIVCNYAHANPMTKYEQTAEKVFQVPHRDITYLWDWRAFDARFPTQADNCTPSAAGACAGYQTTIIYFNLTYWKGLPLSGRCRLYLHEYYHTLQVPPLLPNGNDYDRSWDPHADPVFKSLERAQICDKPPIVRGLNPDRYKNRTQPLQQRL